MKRRRRKHRNPALPNADAVVRHILAASLLTGLLRQLGTVDVILQAGDRVCPVCNGTGEIKVVDDPVKP